MFSFLLLADFLKKPFLQRATVVFIAWSFVGGPICSFAATQRDTDSKTAAVQTAVSLVKNTAAEKYSASNFKAPIGFEPNLGQLDAKAKFRSHGLAYDVS